MPFGIGVPELIVVLVVALVFFGPRRLPELGSSLGKAIREFRRATTDMTRDLREGIDGDQPAPANSAAQPAAPVPEQVICVGCAATNPRSNKFCGACGKDLQPPPALTAVGDIQPVICAHCTTVNPATTKFCRECGRELVAKPLVEESKESHVAVEQHPN